MLPKHYASMPIYKFPAETVSLMQLTKPEDRVVLNACRKMELVCEVAAKILSHGLTDGRSSDLRILLHELQVPYNK